MLTFLGLILSSAGLAEEAQVTFEGFSSPLFFAQQKKGATKGDSVFTLCGLQLTSFSPIFKFIPGT